MDNKHTEKKGVSSKVGVPWNALLAVHEWALGWAHRFAGGSTFDQGKADGARDVLGLIRDHLGNGDHALDKLVERHVEVLHENEQLRARYKEQCARIEQLRDEVQNWKQQRAIDLQQWQKHKGKGEAE